MHSIGCPCDVIVLALYNCHVYPCQCVRFDFISEEDFLHTIELDQRLQILGHAHSLFSWRLLDGGFFTPASSGPERTALLQALFRIADRVARAGQARVPHFSRMRSYASYADMSERITWSPPFRPERIPAS